MEKLRTIVIDSLGLIKVDYIQDNIDIRRDGMLYMGKNIIVRGFTCAFALVLCVSTITGCGKNKNAVAGIAGSETAQNGKEYIYEMEKLDGILLEGEALNSLVYVNGKVRGIGAIGGRKLRCISFNPDGTDVQAFYIDSDKDFRQDRAVFDDEGNLYIKVRERSQAEGEEDSEDFSSEEKYYLLKFDSTGKELYRTDLSEKFSKGAENIDLMSYSNKYGLILVMDQGVMTYDETNGYNKIKPKFISNLRSVVKLSDTQLLLQYDSGGLLEQFDLDTKEVKRDLIKRMRDNTAYKYFQCADNVYMSNDEGVYSLDTDSFKIEKLLDYNLSQISNLLISEIVAIEGDEFITTTSNRSGNNFVYRLYKADPKDIDEKNYITFGAVGFSPKSLNAIREFNKTNDTYQIKMIDYSELYPDDPWGQLDLDIITGKMPDVIELGQLDDLTKKKYIEKGVFLDLTQAFSKEGALGDIELLSNIAEMMKVDGKIYTFSFEFTFDTCMIRTGLADGKKSFSYEDCDNLIKSVGTDYDVAFGMYDNSSLILSRILKYYIDMFIDKEKGNCNFRDSRFFDLLNFAARFPAKKTDNIDFFRDRFYDDDRAIFYLEDICEADEYARLKQCVFHDGVEFIGIPNNSGKNLASISLPICAVNSKTDHSDVVCNLIREMMLSEEENRNGFSVVKRVFENQLQEATKEKKESDINYYGIDEANDVTVKMEPLSQDEVQKIYDYVLSIKTLNPRNEVVEKIINEEAAAFFCGQKTLEEVVELIQNRVTTYLNENS